MDMSSDGEVNVLSGMYGIQDRQIFKSKIYLQIIHVL